MRGRYTQPIRPTTYDVMGVRRVKTLSKADSARGGVAAYPTNVITTLKFDPASGRATPYD